MSSIEVFLFGKVEFRLTDQVLPGLEPHKVQELFCYLLLYRQRSHPREALAGLLWGEHSSSQARSYLRKALWQLHTTLAAPVSQGEPDLLLVDADWVQMNPQAHLALDVSAFEAAYQAVQGKPGRELDGSQADTVRAAVDLYRGDLMEGWYADWTLFERQRLQYAYLAMLDKLMDYSEVQGQYEAGIAYSNIILRYDRARERTHRKLMRLHTLNGDRTMALRQYERCKDALWEELQVGPSARTRQLYRLIQADRLPRPAPPASPSALHPASTAPTRHPAAQPGPRPEPVGPEQLALPGDALFAPADGPLQSALSQLFQLRASLNRVQSQIQKDIQKVKQALSQGH